VLTAFINCLKIPELRQRILLTLGLICVVRLGTHIPVPGLDPSSIEIFYDQLTHRGGNGVMNMLNLFTGGALRSGSILALGIMPYINASIFMQLFAAVEPHMARLQQEGDVGRQKISQYTRYATIGIAAIQSVMILYALAYFPSNIMQGFTEDPSHPLIIMIGGKVMFIICGTIIMTAGALLLMWVGEQMTQYGIGNGTSLLITVNILSGMPTAGRELWTMLHPSTGVEPPLNSSQVILMIGLLLIVVAGIVALTQGMRKIPVHYAKRVVGRRVFQSQSSFLPLKANFAGVMPIIFTSAILMFPQQLFYWLHAWFGISLFQNIATTFTPGTTVFYCCYTFLIFAFSFFWVSLMFKPVQVADEIKRNGGYIPGVPPGEPTAKFLDFTMTRLTFAGAIALTAIAVIPQILMSVKQVPWNIAQYFGGSSMLIMVAVLLDTMRQVETFLLQRHYDGFLRKGRAKSNASRATQTLDQQEIRNLRPLWIPLGILIFAGVLAWLYNRSH
jgi:preprotein translocase subunit SecY